MIIVMASRKREDIDRVIEKIQEFGYQAHLIEGVERTVIGAVGDERLKDRLQSLESLPGVESVVRILKPYKLAGRELRKDDSIFHVGSAQIGGSRFCVMAGPCSVESREQIRDRARRQAALRCGAARRRIQAPDLPYSFQGLEEEGLHFLQERQPRGLRCAFITEVMTPNRFPSSKHMPTSFRSARNMQNYGLLKAVGKAHKPVFQARHDVHHQRILHVGRIHHVRGKPEVVLCERGNPDLRDGNPQHARHQRGPGAQETHPSACGCDPSHATGHWELVPPMARAAVAAYLTASWWKCTRTPPKPSPTAPSR